MGQRLMLIPLVSESDTLKLRHTNTLKKLAALLYHTVIMRSPVPASAQATATAMIYIHNMFVSCNIQANAVLGIGVENQIFDKIQIALLILFYFEV